MRYLGLDLGTKTLGVALTDKSNTISTPLKTIRFEFEKYESVLEELEEIITKNNVSEIIDNLVASFNQDFPVYKGSNNADNVNSSGRCVFDKFKANLIILPKNPKSYSSNNISSIRPEQKNGFKNIKKRFI